MHKAAPLGERMVFQFLKYIYSYLNIFEEVSLASENPIPFYRIYPLTCTRKQDFGLQFRATKLIMCPCTICYY